MVKLITGDQIISARHDFDTVIRVVTAGIVPQYSVVHRFQIISVGIVRCGIVCDGGRAGILKVNAVIVVREGRVVRDDGVAGMSY